MKAGRGFFFEIRSRLYFLFEFFHGLKRLSLEFSHFFSDITCKNIFVVRDRSQHRFQQFSGKLDGHAFNRVFN